MLFFFQILELLELAELLRMSAAVSDGTRTGMCVCDLYGC